MAQTRLSVWLQQCAVVCCGLCFLGHFIISIYITDAFRSIDPTLFSLSASLYFIVWTLCLLIISCLLLHTMQDDLVTVLRAEIRTRNSCALCFVMSYYFCCGLSLFVLIPTVLPFITTFGAVYYYKSTLIDTHRTGSVSKEHYLCFIAYQLAIMLPQFIVQTICYQTLTKEVGNAYRITGLFWINSLLFMLYIIIVCILMMVNTMSHHRSSLLKTQRKVYIVTVAMEWTIFFYVIFMLQILNSNQLLFFEGTLCSEYMY